MKSLCLMLCACIFSVSVFSDDVFRFSADKMIGARASGKELTILSGNAMVISDDLELRADRIELSGSEYRFIECIGAVTGLDTVKGMLFKTERLVYDRENKLASLEGSSSIEDKQNELVAKARFIEYNDESGIALMQVSVRIFKGELVCRSEYALYNKEAKTLELSGRPVVYRGKDRFNAERIFVDLETEDVRMEGSVSGSITTSEKDEGPEPSQKPSSPATESEGEKEIEATSSTELLEDTQAEIDRVDEEEADE